MAGHKNSTLAEAVCQIIEDYEKAKRRFLDRIRHAPNRYTRGTISWSREELHER